jgi:hypothetical protein
MLSNEEKKAIHDLTTYPEFWVLDKVIKSAIDELRMKKIDRTFPIDPGVQALAKEDAIATIEEIFQTIGLLSDKPITPKSEGVEDPTVYAKFFTPWTGWTWYITEGEDQNGDYLMFGYTIGHDREWGYISLNELRSVTGPFGLKIERDIHFSPKKKSEIPDIT